MSRFEKLFEPGKIGKLELKNRIIMPPLACGYTTEDGAVTQRMIDYYAERARGGCSMIIVETTYPRPSGYPWRPNISHDRYVPGMAKLAEAIHKGGAKAGIQFIYSKGRGDMVDPATASETVHPKTGARVRAMSVEEIKKVVYEFGEAAVRIKQAGFDCVQIHGGSGYLASEFVSPRLNRRNDEYGGDARRRARLALDLLAVLKKKLGADYPVIYRMTADEKVPGGFGLEDAIILSRILEDAGVDAIDIVAGSNVETFYWVVPYMYLPHGCNVDLAEAVKKEVKVPVCVAGKILDPHLAESILSTGKADFVDLGRALVADPRFLRKVKAKEVADICKCITCLRCLETILKHPMSPMVCTVNPSVGKEKEFKAGLKPAARKKKVLVIGGGPGGMEAAIVAAERGHDVTLWEKDSKLGGLLNIAVIPPGKNDIKALTEYLIRKVKELKVAVRLNKEATVKSVLEFSPDAVVVATGSRPLFPEIRGAQRKKAILFSDVLLGKVDVGKKVIVSGGNFVGCETADFLVEKGKDVTIITGLPGLASEMYYAVSDAIVHRLRDKGVKSITGIKDREITGKGMDIIDRDGKRMSLQADDIVIAAGSVPDRSLVEALKGKVPELYDIGDCVKARRIQEATSEGAAIGLKL